MMQPEFKLSADLPEYGRMRNLLIVSLKKSFIVLLDGKELCIVLKNQDEPAEKLNENLEAV